MSVDLRRRIHRHLYLCRTGTSGQLRARFPHVSDSQIARALQHLRKSGVVAWNVWAPKEHSSWMLTADGHQQAIATFGVRPRPYRPHDQPNPHLQGTNTVGVAFSQLAATYPDDECSWEVEVGHPYSENQSLATDAVIHYAVDFGPAGVGSIVRFIEFDRGTEPIQTLVAKLKAYMQLRYYTPPKKKTDNTPRPQFLWQNWYTGFPPTLFVFDNNMLPEAADRRGRHLCGAAEADQYIDDNQRLLSASYTSLELLQSHDPFKTRILFDIPTSTPHLLTDRCQKNPQNRLRPPAPSIVSLQKS